MGLTDKELGARAEANFAALSKTDQNRVLELFAKRDRQEQEEFDRAYDVWFHNILEYRETPLEVVQIVVYGMEMGLVRSKPE